MAKYKSLATVTLTGGADRVTTTSTKATAVVFECSGATAIDCSSGVSTSQGAQAAAGEKVALGAPDVHGHVDAFDLSDFYVKGTAAQTVKISYIEPGA